ncbi:uncharacterized protein [Dermacentor andersoni]|uniref:uncharacterized protein n=1 Tax=Dermacentor andersoni TaxID=34620 RepID=UPI0024165433|nr:uncharacterized protein LOC129381452 [Dermacentor andersoni]
MLSVLFVQQRVCLYTVAATLSITVTLQFHVCSSEVYFLLRWNIFFVLSHSQTTPTFPMVSACMGHWGFWQAWVATLAARGLTWLLLYFWASEIYREQQPGIPQTAEAIYGWRCRIVAYADTVASTALASLPVFGPYEYAEAHAVLAAVVMVVTLCVLAAATYLKVMVENDDGTPQYYTTISSIINYGDAAKYFFTAFILHTLTHGCHLINIMATVLQWPLPQKQLQSIWRRILMMTSAAVETVSLPLIAVYRSEQTQQHLFITAVYAMTSLATMSLFFIEQSAVRGPFKVRCRRQSSTKGRA